MNWLIYIPGYWFGVCLLFRIGLTIPFVKYKGRDITPQLQILTWTLFWIGICYKFIK